MAIFGKRSFYKPIWELQVHNGGGGATIVCRIIIVFNSTEFIIYMT